MLKLFSIFALLLLVAFIFSTCSSNYTKKDDIYIRIDNQTGKEIIKLWLGNRIIKPNSYSSTGYQTIFKNIPNRTKSDYQQNVGKFWGYSRGSGNFADSTQLHLRSNMMKAAVQQSNIPLVNTTMTHPYNGKTFTEPSLPDGKYTFILKQNPSRRSSSDLIVKIVKD